MIQIDTVSRQTPLTDYWPAEFFRTVEFVDSTMEKEREAHVAHTESIGDAIEAADYDSFIVTMNPELMYHHPEADVVVEVYDGYNE